MEKDDEGNPYIPTFADGRIYLAHRSHSWLWYNRVMQGDFEYVGLGFVSNDHLAVLPFIPMDTKVRMLSHAILGGGQAGNATAAALGRRARADGGLASTAPFRFAVCGSVPSDGRI